jgi:putative endonuclease
MNALSPLHRQKLGKLGEDIAASFLTDKGYSLLDRNFKARYGEIDIVAMQGDTLVFVEVKTRLGDTYGQPQEAVTPRKLHEVIQTAQYYATLHSELPEDIRIDVVAIVLTPDQEVDSLEHIENVTL